MAFQGKVVVIDDELGICSSLSGILADEGYSVVSAQTGEKGLSLIARHLPDVCFLDVWLPDLDGFQVLEKIRQTFPDVGVVMISGHASVESAVRCVRNGALDFIEKPLSLEKVVLAVENAMRIKVLKSENQNLRNKFDNRYRLLGNCKEIRKIKDTIELVASTQSTVLITGENGTGKENVARNIHEQSGRAKRPFVAINCAAIPEELIESELFGYEKGAFTGANSLKRGKFELANTGTLFLDEIGDMSLKTQSKLLRVLQEQKLERLGGHDAIEVDVRIISATNRNLEELILKGAFREDLYYRINVIPIFVPPLRERLDDIIELCNHFLEVYSSENGIAKKVLSESVIPLLVNYSWPGNVRELKNVMERLTIMVKGSRIEVADLPFPISQPSHQNFLDSSIIQQNNFRIARASFEKIFLRTKLQQCNMSISKTAEMIGLERSHLHRKLRAYDIIGDSDKKSDESV